MPINELSYYVGRVNLMPTQPNLDAKRELFANALGARETVRRSQHEWTFLDIEEIELDGRNYFAGFLVKYKPESRAEIADLQSRKLQIAVARDLVDAKARFFVEVETGIIFYHPAIPRIKRNGFESRFEQLFEAGLGKFFINVEIDPIRERFSIIEELPKFDSITLVDITLRPSNPDNSELWANEDEKLKAWNAKWRREQICGTEENGGLNIRDDPEVRGKLLMAEDGYGEALVRGRRAGRIKRVSSRDAQLRFAAPNDEQESKFVLATLAEVIADLMRRFS